MRSTIDHMGYMSAPPSPPPPRSPQQPAITSPRCRRINYRTHPTSLDIVPQMSEVPIKCHQPVLCQKSILVRFDAHVLRADQKEQTFLSVFAHRQILFCGMVRPSRRICTRNDNHESTRYPFRSMDQVTTSWFVMRNPAGAAAKYKARLSLRYMRTIIYLISLCRARMCTALLFLK